MVKRVTCVDYLDAFAIVQICVRQREIMSSALDTSSLCARNLRRNGDYLWKKRQSDCPTVNGILWRIFGHGVGDRLGEEYHEDHPETYGAEEIYCIRRRGESKGILSAVKERGSCRIGD